MGLTLPSHAGAGQRGGPTDLPPDLGKAFNAIRLGFGTVWHQRSRPRVHQFRYRAFFVAVPAQVLLGPPAGNWLFGINRRALISVHQDGHALPTQPTLATNLNHLFESQEVTLFCFARVLGYEFKPVSFWVSPDKILAEVHNTFGERHAYLLRKDQALKAEKRFHVSPFCDVKGSYEFEIDSTVQRFTAAISYFDRDGLPALIKTRMSGNLTPVTTGSCMTALLGYPLFSLAVIVGIHWQAARLWIKKVPWFSKPVPPTEFLTHAIAHPKKNE